MTLCNLGVGATFGESILHDLPRDSTVVTKTTCELLRVEQQDFRLIWEVSALHNFVSIILSNLKYLPSYFIIVDEDFTFFQHSICSDIYNIDIACSQTFQSGIITIYLLFLDFITG